MMAEQGFEVDHASVHRWIIKLVPLFEKAFRKHNRPVSAARCPALCACTAMLMGK
jgi:transposase-like protein